jgi:hypothetical protein
LPHRTRDLEGHVDVGEKGLMAVFAETLAVKRLAVRQAGAPDFPQLFLERRRNVSRR